VSAAESSGSAASGADKDWRLRAELHVPEPHASLHALVERFRGSDAVRDARSAVPHDVVVTHDGSELFAYAADESLLASARQAIEQALREDGVDAQIRISHWDDELDEWRQTDPPPSAGEQRAQQAAERSAETVQTRTVVASAGKLIRGEFEQSLRTWAEQLGVQCEVIEHPHLLTTQVAFTVTGPRRKIDEFLAGVTAEEAATIRTERVVMLSPL
jgi:hypothetical protein